MMLLNKLKHKKLLIFMVIIIVFSIYSIEVVLGFFYLKNGKSLKINSYNIEFPFLHWANFGENKLVYVVTGKTIDSNTLIAEFLKDAEVINIEKIISNCDNVEKKFYSQKNIEGNVYLCVREKKETMYFQSNDKEIFIREQNYNSLDKDIVREYHLLFSSLKHSP